jgi:hypothetical protein
LPPGQAVRLRDFAVSRVMFGLVQEVHRKQGIPVRRLRLPLRPVHKENRARSRFARLRGSQKRRPRRVSSPIRFVSLMAALKGVFHGGGGSQSIGQIFGFAPGAPVIDSSCRLRFNDISGCNGSFALLPPIRFFLRSKHYVRTQPPAGDSSTPRSSAPDRHPPQAIGFGSNRGRPQPGHRQAAQAGHRFARATVTEVAPACGGWQRVRETRRTKLCPPGFCCWWRPRVRAIPPCLRNGELPGIPP